MTLRKSTMSLALPLALLTTIALAQDDPAVIMDALDADGSGTLSEAEASGNEMIMSKWDELDVDGNAEISAAELTALVQ